MTVQPLFREDTRSSARASSASSSGKSAPHHARWERRRRQREVWKKAGDAGLAAHDIPTEYGGGGADFLTGVILNEEMTRGVYTGRASLHSISALLILHYGSEDQNRNGCRKWQAARRSRRLP